MATSFVPDSDADVEEIQPDLSTVRLFEDGGRQYRAYLTRNGTLACDRFDPETEKWVHLPLRMLSEQELSKILALRNASEDEEIARALAAVQKR